MLILINGCLTSLMKRDATLGNGRGSDIFGRQHLPFRISQKQVSAAFFATTVLTPAPNLHFHTCDSKVGDEKHQPFAGIGYFSQLAELAKFRRFSDAQMMNRFLMFRHA